MLSRKAPATFFVLLVVVLPISSWKAEAAKRAWDIKDQYRIKTISDIVVSPDSEIVLFVLAQRDPVTYEPSSSFWALPAGGGEARAVAGPTGSVSTPRWSPDGRRVAYFATGKGGLGLWVMNRDGSGARKLVDVERSNAYLGMRGNEIDWSPDGRRIAYNAAGARYYSHPPTPLNPPTGNEVMVVDRLLYKAFYYYSDMRRTYVYVISADGGEPEQISFGDYDYHSISFSPDGKKIACISNRTGRDDYNSNNDICILSTEGKDLVQLTQTVGPEYWPVWSPDGSKIAYLNRLRDRRSKESDAEQYKVYVIAAAGGATVDLTAPLDQWSQSPTWADGGRSVYFTAQNRGRVGLYRAPVEGARVTPIVEDRGQLGSYSLSKAGEVYYTYQDPTHPPEIYRIGADGTGREKLSSLNQEFTEEVSTIEPEPFTFQSFDGLEVEGWLMRPLGFREGGRYPLVLSIHGGPHAQYGYNVSPVFQYLVANGYAVLFTNPRGISGYGQRFSDACVGDLGGGDYRDIMAAVDHVLAKYPFIDLDHMGVTGGSYGGYMTNWVITHTNRFKAAVPVASISNLISDWADANPDWFESDGGFVPFEDYERAWAMSPLKYVANCKTPTLFIHGAWDFCVNLGQAEEMYTALKKLGVDSVLAIYPNEGHGFTQPSHVMDYHQRALDWFDKYLKN